MSLTPSKVTWDPNRYKAHEWVITYDSNGNAQLSKKEADYTGVNYNFSSLPSGLSTTSSGSTTATSNNTTQNTTTIPDMGNVMPLYAQKDDNDPFKAPWSKDKSTMTDANTVMGFKVNEANAAITDANVGHEAFDKSERQKEFESDRALQAKYGTFQEYNKALDSIQGKDSAFPGRNMDKFRARFDQTYRDEWVEDTESNPRGSTYSGYILKSERDKLARERKAKLDKLRNVPIIGSRLAAGTEFIRNITPRTWRATDTQKFNKEYFSAYTSGSMAGRITGDDGKYDPANNLYHGMNRNSHYGNLEQAGQKRIDRIEKTLAKWEANPTKYADKLKNTTLYDRKEKFEKQQNDYRKEKNERLVEKAVKKGASTTNPAEMHAATGGGGGADSGSKSKIVCTMMNQRYGFGSFRNKIWLKFHKDYSPEYQKGYHKVFLPLVSIAKKEGIFNTLVRKILEHMGRHVTADMFQIMRNKKSDKLGRIYRKIFEPICYWLGKK